MVHFERAKPHYIETLNDILELLSPKEHSLQAGEATIEGFEVDSRRVKPGYVFVAAPGARVDGHDYIASAIEKGAIACIVSKKPESGKLFPNSILVKDSLVALGYLAAAHRRSLPTKIIGITGSVGKTTTKEMVYNLLSPHFYTKKSEGNFNSTIGLPLQLLKLRRSDEVMVAELGMSFPGEIRSLMRIALPDIGVWTSVKNAHLVNFESIEEIAKAKAEMVDELGQDKTLIFNADDALVTKYSMGFQGNRIGYGFMSPNADICGQISAFSDWLGTDFFVDYPDGVRGRAHLPVPGKFNIHNAVAAAAVAWHMELKHNDFASSFRRDLDVKGRSRLEIFDPNVYLVDDSYNSSPYAVAQVIRSFCSLSESTYRWIILGDMLEQGRNEIGIHRVLGHELAQSAFDRVTFVGDLVKHAYQIFLQYTDGHAKVEHFQNAESATEIAQILPPPNSRIWIKGSRSMGLERLVKVLEEKLEEGVDSLSGI